MSISEITEDIWPTGNEITDVVTAVNNSGEAYRMHLNGIDFKTVLYSLLSFGNAGRTSDREMNKLKNNAMDILSEVFESVGVKVQKSEETNEPS